MFKNLLSITALTLAFSIGTATTSVAQSSMKTKSDAEKTKTTDGEMTTKTKTDEDGKTKLKGKAGDGSKMKATTKPREGKDMKDMQMSGAGAGSMSAAGGVMVGGAMMTPDKDIVDNAVGSSEHTTLVAAVKAGGLVETLKSAGPFTVFAPTNAAFDKLPAGTVNTLVMPENKQKLTTVLTYHVVPGRLMAADLKDGQTLTTVEGETLTVVAKDGSVLLRDAKGGMATVTIPNVVSSNGITHVIDTVLMPTK
ncbi:MAG: fasciclin domain-containing protein [Hymenobacter sp.]|nr:fasciclin domain-containing protein [Hymenobacter sp.]